MNNLDDTSRLFAQVLIAVSDNLVAQDLASRLHLLGYSVASTSERGADALTVIQSLLPDLILMDIELAENNIDINTARLIESRYKAPIIFLTTNDNHELLKCSLNFSPFTYLNIPLKDRELELTMELALLRHRVVMQSLPVQKPHEPKNTEQSITVSNSKNPILHTHGKYFRDQVSLQRFTAAIDDSADSIYLIDRISMLFIDVNETACERMGYSKDELIALGPHDIKPEFDQPKLEKLFDKIAASQDRFGILETIHQCKNGISFPVEVRLRAIESEGRPIMVAIARDITERVHNERALRQSEEQFRQIAENMHHVLWIRDIATERILYISPAYEEISGQPSGHIYTYPHLLFANIHLDDRKRVTEAVLHNCKDDNDCIQEEYRVLNKKGIIRWITTRTFPIYNQEGQIYRIGAFSDDITARKDSEEKLRLSEEKFRLLFERSPIGVSLVSRNKEFIEVNPEFCNILGYSKDEFINMRISDITHPEDIDSSLSNVDKQFNGNITNFVAEKRYIRKNGDTIWAKLRSTLIQDHNKRPLYGMAIVEDVTQHKHAETLRLAHESAQKMALVREVHHRIKNHLQGVVGLMQLSAQKNSLCSEILDGAIAQINVVATIHGLKGRSSGELVDLLELIYAIANAINKLIPFSFPIRICKAGNLSIYIKQNDSVPIALALNELIVNAAKYSSSIVEILLTGNTDRMCIRILNETIESLSNISPGTGMELVRALLQTEGSYFSYEHLDHQFVAQLILTAPVLQLTQEDNQKVH